MKKYVLLSLLAIGSLHSGYAQEASSAQQQRSRPAASVDSGAEAGDISVSVLFGRGRFLTGGLELPSQPYPGWTVPGTAPYANTVSTNDNSAANIVGMETRYFLSGNLALKLSGAAILRDTPSRMNIQSNSDFDNGNNQVWIPHYEAVEGNTRLDAHATLGAEYHFSSQYKRLSPYAGISIPFNYARRSVYDPSVTIDANGEVVIADVSRRHVEMLAAGGQLVAGLDYYLMEGFYLGLELKPVSYLYAFSIKRPAAGLKNLEADTHTFSFFAQTFLKLGFRL